MDSFSPWVRQDIKTSWHKNPNLCLWDIPKIKNCGDRTLQEKGCVFQLKFLAESSPVCWWSSLWELTDQGPCKNHGALWLTSSPRRTVLTQTPWAWRIDLGKACLSLIACSQPSSSWLLSSGFGRTLIRPQRSRKFITHTCKMKAFYCLLFVFTTDCEKDKMISEISGR